MRILWHSAAPWSPSGYGQQTAVFAPLIRDLGHDVALSATYGLQGAAIEWNGMRMYPSGNDWGNRVLPMYAADHAGGSPRDTLVLTLMDVWTLHALRMAELRMACWCPVDHDPLSLHVADFFRHSGARPIAMSRFGEAKLAEAGLAPLYVPHGIDTDTFQPRPEEAAAYRQQMQVPADAFVVGMVAANIGSQPPRKAFPQVFEAFAEFRRRHADTYIYLHTDLMGREQGLNLLKLAEVMGVPEDSFRASSPTRIELGQTMPDELAAIYSTFDVLANPSYGEGFGIPIVEAQACGTPVIVNDFSAMPELCGSGWLTPGDLLYDPTQGAKWQAPSVQGIVDALEAAYEARGDQQVRDKAREFALAYDARRVLEEFWVPALAALDGPREVPALGNRQQRRKAAKRKPATVAR